MDRAGNETKREKAHLREQSLALRDALTADYRAEASRRLAQDLDDWLDVPPGLVASGFLPIRSELDVRPVMEALAARGARLCLPAILDRTTIVFREFRQERPLVPMGFGTAGPGPEAPVLDPDLMLVPLAAFDARGQRIGYGAGYYDRAIAALHEKGRKPRLIGIAFNCQEVADVPAEPHDQPLDAVLTESGLRVFAPSE